MPYLLDRRHAISTTEIVAVLGVRQRKVRSRVILRDNSLYHTLTRPKTLVRHSGEPLEQRARGR